MRCHAEARFHLVGEVADAVAGGVGTIDLRHRSLGGTLLQRPQRRVVDHHFGDKHIGALGHTSP